MKIGAAHLCWLLGLLRLRRLLLGARLLRLLLQAPPGAPRGGGQVVDALDQERERRVLRGGGRGGRHRGRGLHRRRGGGGNAGGGARRGRRGEQLHHSFPSAVSTPHSVAQQVTIAGADAGASSCTGEVEPPSVSTPQSWLACCY